MTPDLTAEAHRMIGQIDAKNIPLLGWNGRVKRLAQHYINLHAMRDNSAASHAHALLLRIRDEMVSNEDFDADPLVRAIDLYRLGVQDPLKDDTFADTGLSNHSIDCSDEHK